MEVKILFVALLVASALNLVNGGSGKRLPSYFPKCYRDDPDLDSCLLNATDTVRPFLKTGVPELNIPSISPFVIPEVIIEQDPIHKDFEGTLSDIVLTGMDDYQFASIHYDVPKQFFSSSVKIPRLSVEAKFVVKGNVFTVPYEGNGTLHVNITNSNATLTQQAKLVTRKNVTYLQSDVTVVKIDVGETEQTVKLFGGNEDFGKAFTDVVRDNIKDVIKEVKPAVERVMTNIIVDLVNKSISKVPYDKLYPTHEKA